MSIPTFLAAARLRAADGFPYFATALWALCPVPTPGIKTLGVDAYWRLYYDPAAQAWSVEETASTLIHEVGHLLREHHARFKALGEPDENHTVWNARAADPEINDELVAQKLPFPFPIITPKDLGFPDNLLAEEYWSRTVQQSKRVPLVKFGIGNDGKPGDQNSTPMPGAGNCGSCAGGDRRPWEQAAPGETNPDGTKAAEGVLPGDAEFIKREVARQVQEHVKSRGSMPAGWLRWAEQVLRPKPIDWRKELAACVRNGVASLAGVVDYSYARPSRRQSAVPSIVLPVMRRPEPKIAIVADTSGSMSDRELGLILGVIAGVLRSTGAGQIPVLACDAAVHACKRVWRAEQVSLLGGGGTDMGIGMQAALELRPKPELVIVVTDGYTPWPTAAPKTKTVIALLDSSESAYQREWPTPKWAKTVRVREAAA